MKTQIIAVRHGETEWNKIGKTQGHLDSPLSELGILQAKAITESIGHYTIDYFYSSDLGRAVQTSSIISNITGKKFITDARLRERNLGILQGKTIEKYALLYPDEAAKFKSNDPDYVISDGESINQRYKRIINCTEDIALRHFGKSILIVCHGGTLMSFIHKALDIPLTRKRTYSLFNGSINVFSISESKEWNLEIWGDINHLIKNKLGFINDN